MTEKSMKERVIRVGIVGADAKASWAGASHVPALAALPGVELAAIATRQEESARAAATAFGVDRWYADASEMFANPAIDIVTVAVNVPAHRDLVLSALAAGKAVYSEAPLGATVEEAEEMAAAARGRHTAIGLQGRHNPSVRRAGELIGRGALGRLLSARVLATTFGYGAESVSAYAYFDKAASGASFMTITVGHVLDVVEAVLGNISEVDARTERLWDQVALVDTGEVIAREIDDHLDAIVRTASGVSVGVQVLGGIAPQDARFELEVRGTDGWLTLTGTHAAGVQVGDLELASSVDFDTPDAPLATGDGATAADFWSGASVNVGEVYARLARDIVDGTFHTPGFDHAVHNSRLVARVARAASSGRRQ